MLPLMKIGSAAGALGNALVPSPAPIPRPSPAARYLDGTSVQVAFGSLRSREAAEATALHAEQTWFGAPSLGRVAGAFIGLVAAAWYSRRQL